MYVTDKSETAGASNYYGFVAQGIDTGVFNVRDSIQYLIDQRTGYYNCNGKATYGCVLDLKTITRIEDGSSKYCDDLSPGNWPSNPWSTV